MPTATFTADAVFTDGLAQRHDRTRDHHGTMLDTSIVLSATIGTVTAGSTLADFLDALYVRIGSVQAPIGSTSPPATGLRRTHNRELDHDGTLTDADILLVSDIFTYPAGTTLASILTALWA